MPAIDHVQNSTQHYQHHIHMKRPPPCVCTPQVIDRVHFIINNITVMNTEQKVKELKAQVGPDYWPWFANYLVVKRAAQVRAVWARAGGEGSMAQLAGLRRARLVVACLFGRAAGFHGG